MVNEKVIIYIGDKAIELKGAELEAFNEQRAKDQTEAEKIKAEQQAQKQLKISAYQKLGLTEAEINAIL